VDCRWNVIAGSVDDRTKEERGLEVFISEKIEMGISFEIISQIFF
jgi:hypothetical protein